MKRHLIGVAAVVLGTALVGGVSVQTASAVDAPTTVTLPMFGVPLTIGITSGPGSTLADVTIDPADSNVATDARPHKVTFESANPTAGGDPGKVTVKSKRGGQSVSARGGSLADVSGDGSWSGDLFNNGTASTVTFTIAADADGNPDITGTAIGAGSEAGVVGDVKRSTGDDDDESSASARQSVKFTSADGSQSRSVTISVKVKTNEDGETSAKLSISLGKLKGEAIAAADAAGPHTFSDVLCDGTAATITYDVAEDGTVSNVVATPDAEVKTNDSKIDVRFSHDERVRIRVREDDGQIKISVDNRIRCRDAEDPTVNGSAVPTTVDDDDEGEDNGGHHGRGGHDDDDDTTTTVTTVG